MATKQPTMNELETMTTMFRDVNLAKIIAAKDLADAYDAGLAALDNSLPANFPLEAKRKINEMRGQVAYARTAELPNLITQYSPTPVVEVPFPAPVQDATQVVE